MSKEYEDLKKECARIKKLRDKHQAALDALIKTCPHEEIEEKSFYSPGGYLNTSYTEYWNQCKFCGAKSESTIDNHGTYG